MESVRHDLMLMIHLQRIYDQIRQALEQRSTPPSQVQELQERNRIRRQELEELEQKVAAHQLELKEVNRREKEWEVELEHFQRQKSTVTNEREFTAVLSELDFATKGRDECVARKRELDTAIAELTADIASRRQARPDEEAAQHVVVSTWEARKGELRQHAQELSEQAKALQAQLQPPHRARFLRLLEGKRGIAVAAVVDGSCSLCHFSLRPHLQQRVRRGEEIIACEHCHRILYLAELEEGT